MAYYIVYWPQDRVEELKKAGDTGPIKVVYGSIHSRMPRGITSSGRRRGVILLPSSPQTAHLEQQLKGS